MKLRRAPLVVLLTALPLLMSCGKYPSKRQADSACWEWADRGGTAVVNIQWKQPNRFGKPAVEPKEMPLRDCEEEQETRQFIGFTRHRERSQIDTHTEGSDAAMSNWQPKAHFRY